ncbi:uncharacterized protein si:ch211-13c6.2 [Anguilla rostrata]|uniref:uncharacterized protein si:ch211-13c6.2 n=1 Tax=Anguilla rostrata TaxID=7938 RepID=UPI0030CBA5B8
MENIVSTYDDDEVDFIVCDVCNIKIRTDAMYRIHLTTIQHLKKVEALVAAGKARRDQSLPVWTSYTHYLDYLQLDEPIIGLKHLVEVETPPGSLGPRYLCRLCRFDADLPDMTNHIIGRKHRQKYLETQRPDLVTWDRSSASQPGKVVRAKAEVAERQDGRGVPERSKRRSAALEKSGTLKVPSPQWRGGQTSAQGGARGGLANKPIRPLLDQHGHARYRDLPPGRGHPEQLPESFASREEWKAEQPRRRRSLEKDGGFGGTDGLPVDSHPAYHHGDRMYPENEEERRGRIYEDEPRKGGVYEDEGRRGGAYEGEGRRGGAYEEEGRRGEGLMKGKGGGAGLMKV